MPYSPNWKITKTGVISLCLLALVGCSTTENVRYQPIKPPPLICPKSHQCQIPPFHIQNNGDLAKTLDHTLTVIELCEIELQAWEKCVDEFNQRNGNEKGSLGEP